MRAVLFRQLDTSGAGVLYPADLEAGVASLLAEASGQLREYDPVLAINGTPISQTSDFASLLRPEVLVVEFEVRAVALRARGRHRAARRVRRHGARGGLPARADDC